MLPNIHTRWSVWYGNSSDNHQGYNNNSTNSSRSNENNRAKNINTLKFPTNPCDPCRLPEVALPRCASWRSFYTLSLGQRSKGLLQLPLFSPRRSAGSTQNQTGAGVQQMMSPRGSDRDLPPLDAQVLRV